MEGAWVRRALIPLAALCAVLMTACGGGQGKQLDTPLRDVPGSGTSTTQLSNFPHARYTFFTDEDPPGCVRLVQLQDQQGNFVAGDQVEQQSPPPGVSPQNDYPGPVQQDIPDGAYKVHIVASTSRCAWMIEEVLNSMSTQDAPPSPQPAVPAPAWAGHVDSAGPTTVIAVPLTGIYDVSLSTGYPSGMACVVHKIGFRNATGDFESILQFGQGGGHAIGQDGPMFLVAGARTVSADTTCPWQISLKPWIGALGGGTRGFIA
jgi:hypothetical protein